MTTRARLVAVLFFVGALSAGCDTEDPSQARVKNAYPSAADGGVHEELVTVYRLWWTTTLFAEPILPGAESGLQRVVPDRDYAFALVAPGWDATTTRAPERLLALRSKTKLTVERGGTLEIDVSAETFNGDCADGNALSQDQADFIVQRIFPGSVSGLGYDAATCTSTAVSGADTGVPQTADD
jgi:hypothetical protein